MYYISKSHPSTESPLCPPNPQAYMEDHLKNKDRLLKEWEALCSYQAEPSTMSVAQSDTNLKKNRCPDSVPCKFFFFPSSSSFFFPPFFHISSLIYFPFVFSWVIFVEQKVIAWVPELFGMFCSLSISHQTCYVNRSETRLGKWTDRKVRRRFSQMTVGQIKPTQTVC